ncbi:hypothetical protein K440DRAFT_636131 [Wilcoxina mikolae CBS 423.85]|nr:hypothetical protein K440DRAFT_636131 [Wilcoxina mikolae CBS 423.85]
MEPSPPTYHLVTLLAEEYSRSAICVAMFSPCTEYLTPIKLKLHGLRQRGCSRCYSIRCSSPTLIGLTRELTTFRSICCHRYHCNFILPYNYPAQEKLNLQFPTFLHETSAQPRPRSGEKSMHDDCVDVYRINHVAFRKSLETYLRMMWTLQNTSRLDVVCPRFLSSGGKDIKVTQAFICLGSNLYPISMLNVVDRLHDRVPADVKNKQDERNGNDLREALGFLGVVEAGCTLLKSKAPTKYG